MPFNSDPRKPLVWELDGVRLLMFSAAHVQSRMDTHAPDALLLEYTRAMMGFLLLHPQPRSIAMVGLGGGSLPKFCHRYLPHSRITVVEISAEVIALRELFAVPADSSRFAVHRADAAEFFRHNDAAFEVLLVDGFDADGIAPALATAQFYSDCRRALHPDGMLVANLHGCSADYDRTLEHLRTAFDGEVLEVACPNRSNRVVFAAARNPAALRAMHEVRCPPDFDTQAWRALVPSLVRVALASRALPTLPNP